MYSERDALTLEDVLAEQFSDACAYRAQAVELGQSARGLLAAGLGLVAVAETTDSHLPTTSKQWLRASGIATTVMAGLAGYKARRTQSLARTCYKSYVDRGTQTLDCTAP